MKPVRLIKRKRRIYADNGVATPLRSGDAMDQKDPNTGAVDFKGQMDSYKQREKIFEKTELSPEEYQQKMMAAYDKYGTDVGLAFDPNSQTFMPGNVMLDAAEVTADFVPRNEDEANAYKNLGVQGAMEMRKMQEGIREDTHQFADTYMRPVLEAGLTASSAGKGIQALGYGAKALRAASGPLAKYFAKQAGKKALKLAGKKGIENPNLYS
jgi:hypothetical protein|tara:strand:- start:946 stop:1578 length:633 start_codon:yes stop_codon:yes gene_type:complete